MQSRQPEEVLLVDSSVLVKWFTDEEDSDKALELRRRHLDGEIALTIPDLAFYEVANALIFSHAFGPLKVSLAMQYLSDIGLKVVDFDLNVLHVAIETTSECKLAIYDSYFVALADLESLRLVTADKQAVRKTHGISDVVTLADYVGSEGE